MRVFCKPYLLSLETEVRRYEQGKALIQRRRMLHGPLLSHKRERRESRCF